MTRRLFNARLAGVFMLALMLSACARTPVLLDSTREEIAPRTEIGEVPFYAQSEYQCGPASLAMVLEHQGETVSIESLIRQVYVPGREGSLQPEMLATVRRHGLIAYPIRPTVDALLGHLDADEPVVVLQNLSLPLYPMWHYAVAIGYDLPGETLILRSGEIPRHTLSLARFDATWARSQRWGFVVKPPGELAAGVPVRSAIEAISAFEAVQGQSAALDSWQALVERHPDSALGWFALGNARYADGEPLQAVEAFETATRLDPALGAAWLNLGLLLTQLGQNGASAAFERAAALEGPWQEKARDHLGR
ncbi:MULTISPECIES: PA2778 family cysteine peptidase [unclassified Halomonas]|uniref:PA2778 family cysteine peptidase n=1 Tax=unclassified Halomonas TaxID=2609666 RepID=UPI0020A0BB50|nr:MULTISPECIES: PA2778 family cysteine peptidase [unclassified Halomonas]MCP1315875.1 PA2778 family cysteine peptidase [Halomonas sp. 707D7]MCP1327965.1 PA2778 family cysteine peptidase [Halomonas sp. 707D4]